MLYQAKVKQNQNSLPAKIYSPKIKYAECPFNLQNITVSLSFVVICYTDVSLTGYSKLLYRRYSEIVNDLNRSKSCAKTIIDRFNQKNSNDDLLRSERSNITTKKDGRQLVRLVKENITSPSRILAHIWKLSNGRKALDSLVIRRFLERKLEWKFAVRKPSDEIHIEKDNRKNRIQIRRTKSGNGTIGIWCCMSYYG
ncbi:hypothetical protein BpHYR1_042027 [Brachionus plicatilis]|uniref:Uncharacterized protein n=1 Tax=Brachionus plicatilis TaxID=10195 RepID=A0A3M7PU96_BRAPC|nr:hypothetical protein BpHYR1_042027 [Brachionus plicatilis]